MPTRSDKPTNNGPRTRADYVVGRLRNYIFSNGLKPGDQLPSEHDLAQQLDVSRPTIREAIKGLSVSGLLEARPRTGTRVREFTYDQIVDPLVAHFFLDDTSLREILEARAALEMSALPLVIRRVTTEQIVEMREIQAKFERTHHDNGNHVQLDLKLHQAVLAATGNRLLMSMVGLLRAFFAHPHLEDAIIRRHYDREEQERTINEHRLMIEAFAARDGALASRVMEEHFNRQLRWLEREEEDKVACASGRTDRDQE